MSKQIAFTADDLGWDEPTNLAIESAHREGVLTDACLMLGQPGSAHAVEVARRNPALHIGWHFHTCDSIPVTRRRWPWGRSAALAGLMLGCWPYARALVRHEISVQWEQFKATGIPCAFVNGHHHLHIHPFITREMRRVVTAEFSGWVRGYDLRFFSPNWREQLGYRWLRRPAMRWLEAWSPIRRSDSLWGIERLFSMRADEVAAVLPMLPDGLHEFMFHPRQVGDADHTALIALREQASQQDLRGPQPLKQGR
jgi:predicted glycoside hydrolase/deacetylase ChbG (UPF0249 family)